MDKIIIEKLNLVKSDKSTGASFLNNETIWFSDCLESYVMECGVDGFKHPKGLITIMRCPLRCETPSCLSPEFLKEADISDIKEMLK